jgi:hypothetical protein
VDLLVEVYKNSEKIAEAGSLHHGSHARSRSAKEVVVAPTLGSAQTFNGETDKLSMSKLLTRIGTSPGQDGGARGHARALRACGRHFDGVGRASRLDTRAAGEN